MSKSAVLVRLTVLASLALPFLFGANCAPTQPSSPQGDPAGSPLPDFNVDPSSGAPIPRAPQKGDVASVSATKSFAVTGIRLGARVTIPLSVTLLPPEVDSSFLQVRIARVQDESENTLWQLVDATDVAPAEYGTLGEIDSNLGIDYVAPDLVLEELKVTIVISAPLAGEPGIAGEVPADEFSLGSFLITLLPPDAPLTVIASSYPQSITVDGNGGTSATTTTLRAEILGGQLMTGNLYEVFWTVNGLPLTAPGSYEPVLTEDADGDGVDDLIVSEKTVTANELRAIAGTGLLVLNVTARDAAGSEINDVAYVTVNEPLAVTATMTPEVFVGDGELRTVVSANVTGGAGAYAYQWISAPEIPGLFDEVDTTAQTISFRARDVQDLQVSFTVTVTDAAGNTATATARRGGGEDPDPPTDVPGQLVVNINNPPTCAVTNGTLALDGVATGGVEPLGFHWTAACGTFATATAQDTDWTAPSNAQTCAITFTATDKNGLTKSQTIAVKIAQPKVSFVTSSSSVPEQSDFPETQPAIMQEMPEGHQIGVVLSLPSGCSLQEPVTVNLVDLGSGTAWAELDYGPLDWPASVTFPAGSVNGDVQYISLGVFDDNIDEDNETIILGLVDATGGAGVGPKLEHVVTIVDDDEAVLSLVESVSASEDASGDAFTFAVRLSNPSVRVISVNFATADGTATVADSDYAAADGTLTFDPMPLGGVPDDQLITIAVTPDAYYELAETFRLTLSSPFNARLANPALDWGAKASATGTIENDDEAPVVVTADSYVVEGDGGTGILFFTVKVVGLTKLPVKVEFATEQGTSFEKPWKNATPRTGGETPDDENDDFESTSGTLTFLPGQTIQQIPVTIYGDTYVEKTEEFWMNYHVPADGNAQPLAVGPAHREGRIRNDDGDIPGLDIAPEIITITEGQQPGTFNVALELTGNPPTGKVEVSLGYDPTQVQISPAKLTFNANNYTSYQTVTVEAVNDLIAEGPQTTEVILQAASTDPSYNGLVGAVLVKISENDTSNVILATLDDSATEGGDTARYSVVLSTQPTDVVTITISADGQSSVNPTVLTFDSSNWSTPQEVEVTANDDADVEGAHRTTITHTAASTDAHYNNIVIAAQAIDVVDNDATVVSVENPVDIAEGDTGSTFAIFNVKLSVASAQIVEVDYATADGAGSNGAIAGEDYEATSGTLRFLPGELGKQVLVRIYGDVTVEDTERFRLVLSNPVDAILGDAAENVFILNDDAALVSVSDIEVVEGTGLTNTTFVFPITLSRPSDTPIVIEYKTEADSSALNPATGGNGLPGSDYAEIAGGTLTILAGQTTGQIAVSVRADVIDEPNESFRLIVTSVSAGGAIDDGTAVASILDDDGEPVLSLLPHSRTVTEGNSAAFAISLLPPSSQPVKVIVSTKDGAATIADNDYASHTETITFNPGEILKSVDIPTSNDNADEPQEQFEIVLSSPTNATILPGWETGTIRINDNDGPPILAVQSAIQVAEGDAGQNAAVFIVTLTGPTDRVVTSDYATADGSATTADSDYAQVSGTLTFVPGQTTQLVVVPVNGDDLVEADETFTLNLSNVQNAVAGTPSATCTIINDDHAEITVTDIRVDEGTGIASLTVTTSKALAPGQPALTIDWATAAGTATGGDVDYTDGSGQVSVPADGVSRSASINLAIVDDTVGCEGDEQFSVTLSAASLGTIVKGVATVTITDNDGAPTLSVANAGVVNEGEDLQFTVTLSGRCVNPITVFAITDDGTATLAGDDYAHKAQKITFTDNGSTSQSVVVTVRAKTDGLDEGNNTPADAETVYLNLLDPQNAIVADAQGVGRIQDINDPVVASISQNQVVSEDAGVTIWNIKLDKPSAVQVKVRVYTQDGDGGATQAAIAGQDYVSLNQVVAFGPGEVNQQVAVRIRPDDLFEEAEAFSVLLDAVENVAIDVGGGSRVCQIAANDTPTIGIRSDVTGSENSNGNHPTFTFRVDVSNPIDSYMPVITVRFRTDNAGLGDTADAVTDYLPVDTVLTFTAGVSSIPVGVTVLADNGDEPDEFFTVNLSNKSAGTWAVQSRRGTILDNDGTPRIAIAAASPGVEGNSSTDAAFNVTLIGESSQTVTVNWHTSNGTAIADGDPGLGTRDYDADSGTLIWNPGDAATKQIVVKVRDDNLYEGLENFFVQIDSPTNAQIAAAANMAEGSIQDNETEPTLSIGDAGVTEGNSGTAYAAFNVTLSGPTTRTVTVQYATNAVTATPLGAEPRVVGDGDFESVSGSLAFAPGETVQTILVPVLGDVIDEGPNTPAGAETFATIILNPFNASLGSAIGTGSILDDDDAPTVSISSPTINEGSDPVEVAFDVILDAPSALTASVNWATSNSGTAKSTRNDFIATGGSVVFAPGETAKQISVTVNGDTLDENDETLIVNLSGLANIKNTGSTLQGVCAILNDDAPPTVSVASVTATEGNNIGTKNFQFAVTLSAPSGKDVVVSLATADNGSAIAGDDYVAKTQDITFNADSLVLAKNFTVQVNRDNTVEGDETFLVNFTSTNASVVGSPVTGTIQNDD